MRLETKPLTLKNKIWGASLSLAKSGWHDSFYKDGASHFNHYFIKMAFCTTRTKRGTSGRSLVLILLWARIQISMIDI